MGTKFHFFRYHLLMVFVIHTQNRDGAAIQAKLDELRRAILGITVSSGPKARL
jgi:low affinity Fe/Cu permease